MKILKENDCQEKVKKKSCMVSLNLVCSPHPRPRPKDGSLIIYLILQRNLEGGQSRSWIIQSEKFRI